MVIIVNPTYDDPNQPWNLYEFPLCHSKISVAFSCVDHAIENVGFLMETLATVWYEYDCSIFANL